MAENRPPDPGQFAIRIPDAYLIAMGRVTVAWGVLESVIDLAIGRLAGLNPFDPRSAIVTAHMTWPQRMDVLASLCVALAEDHPHLTAFESVKPLLKKAQEGRNLIAHGHWGYEDGKVMRGRLTARGRLRASLAPVSLAEIETVFADIGHAGKAVLKVVYNA